MSATRIALLVAATLFLACDGALARQAPQSTATEQSLAAKIPVNVKQAMLDSINASNSPTADDRQGGFHEEGGLWVTTTDGEMAAEAAVPGTYAKPGEQGHLRVNDAANPLPAARIAAVDGMWHVHPKGETVSRRVLPEKQEGNKRIVTTITTTTHFLQPPSPPDIEVADLPINIVIGAGSKLVYFYDRSSIIGTMPLGEFLAPLQLPASASPAPENKKQRTDR